MATKKRTSKSKRNNNTKGRQKSNRPSVEEVRKAEEFSLEVILWVIIACSLLLFISNLGIGGAVGNYVSNLLFGTFGLVAYVFPILIIIACFFGISNKGNFLAVIKLFAGFYLLRLRVCFFRLFFQKAKS